jgi:hypothetical protein
VEQAMNFAERFERLRADFADELFEMYQFYQRSDLEIDDGWTAADRRSAAPPRIAKDAEAQPHHA